MLSIIIIVAPAFALVALGFVVAKTGYLGPGSGKVLAEFGFKLAMPALLFRAVLNLEESNVRPFALWAAYFGSLAIVWALASAATRFLLRRPATDAPAIAMAAGFGNTVMLGIPMALLAFGPEAATPVALLVSMDTPLLWLIGTLHQEWAGRRPGATLGGAVCAIGLDLVRNPILMAIVLGALFRLAGIGLDPLSDRVLTMLGAAAVPTALVALGMTVAAFELKGQVPTLTVIGVLKLLAFPAIAWLIVTFVVALPPVWANVAILFAALPVGANAYLFAARYERAVGSVSASIAVSTLIAALTVTLVLAALKDASG